MQQITRANRAGSDVAARLRQAYLEDLLGARRKEALEKALLALQEGATIPEIYRDVFQEALYEVGRLWESNRISVAEEHLATAITQFVMSRLYEHLEQSDRQRGRCVLTGVQGELHLVGITMISDLLESDGWEVAFLGGNAEPDAVISAILQQPTALLGIAATLSSNIARVVNLVALVRKECGSRAPRIMLGGRAFAALDRLPEGLEGCCLARDLHEALELTRRMTEQKEGDNAA